MQKRNRTFHRGVRVAVWFVLAAMCQLCALADSYQAVEIKSCELKGGETLSGKQLLVAGTNATLEIALGGYVEKLTACDFAGTPGRQQHTLTCVILIAEPKNETARGHYYMFGKENPASQYGIPAAESIKEFYPDYTLVDYTDVNPAEMVDGQNLKLEFVLEKGDGMHGNFLWHLLVIYDSLVEYDLGEYGWYRVDPISTLAITASGISPEFEKPVFFHKDMKDDAKLPNWFVYWGKDGAVPQLTQMCYSAHPRFDEYFTTGFEIADQVEYRGAQDSMWGKYDLSTGKIYLYDRAGDSHYYAVKIKGSDYQYRPYTKRFVVKYGPDKSKSIDFFTPDGYGIYTVADIIAHETMHWKLDQRYRAETAGMNDHDKQNVDSDFNRNEDAVFPTFDSFMVKWGIFKAPILKYRDKEWPYCDYMTDATELEYNAKFGYGLDIDNVDTFDIVRKNEDSNEYSAYGDNEFMAMMAGWKAVHEQSVVDPEKDWAYPGQQSFLPHPFKPLSGGKRVTLFAAAKVQSEDVMDATGDEGALGQEEPTVVECLSITPELGERDESGFRTGVSYAFSFTTKGTNEVEFTGYLSDLNSNIVAVACTRTTLSPENQFCKLEFSGKDIFSSHRNGPYMLRGLVIRECFEIDYGLPIVASDFKLPLLDSPFAEFVHNDAYLLKDGIVTNGIDKGMDFTLPVEVWVPGDYALSVLVRGDGGGYVERNFKSSFGCGTNEFHVAISESELESVGGAQKSSVCYARLLKGGREVEVVRDLLVSQNGGRSDDPGPVGAVGFETSEISLGEGDALTLRINGGRADTEMTAKLYLSYQTASVADLDLAHATVDGKSVKSLKFPYALTWAKGEIGVKTVTIPVKTDKAIEGSERMTFQLAGDFGADDVIDICTVTIGDRSRAANTTLAQAVWAPNLKLTTSGDAKWAVADDQESEDNLAGVFGVVSPELAMGRYSRLSISGFKGYGSLQVYYQIEGVPEESRTSTVSYALDGKPVGSDAFELVEGSAADEKIAIVYCGTSKSHTVNIDFRQGFEPACRMRILRVLWFPDGVGTLYGIRILLGRAGAGFTTGSGYYQPGEKLKAGLQVCPGWTFVSWYSKETDDDGETMYIPLTLGKSFTIPVGGSADIVAGFEKTPYVLGLADPADRGKVTGSGFCAEGKKVTLKATANKGFVFMGWYRGDGTLVAKTASIVIDRSTKPTKDSASSTTITGITSDVTYYAVYVTAEEDAASIGATVNGFTFGAGSVGEGAVVTKMATNVMAGVYLEWPVAASALSETTVKVAGLPSGLKFTAKPVTSKVTSGTGSSRVTTVVTNVPANTIYGAPTAASKTDKKGKVTPSKVKVTVTTAGKSKVVYEIALTVDPLPAWAQGEFSGLASTPEGRLGSASMSVTAAGKVSGKVIVNGTNCTFTASSYDITSKTVGDTNLVAVVTGKLGKEAAQGGITVVASGATGAFAGAEMSLCRNVWKDKGAAPVPTEAQGLYTVKLGAGERGTGYLSLTVDKKGVVKVAGKAPDGMALSASATLMPDGDGAYFTDVFAAPSGYKGGYVAGRLSWDADGQVSSDGLDWTSFNPQSTADYYAGGFARTLEAHGAWYSKTASLLDYYTTLDFKTEERGVAQACWENLTVSVDKTGKKFVVDQKTTKPVQDKPTKAWSYDGGNDASLAFSFTQATGIWKGSFLWWFEDPKHASQKVPFEGVMVQGEDLEGFGTCDVSASYVPYDKNGNPQKTKTYKYKESVPVGFINGNKDI